MVFLRRRLEVVGGDNVLSAAEWQSVTRAGTMVVRRRCCDWRAGTMVFLRRQLAMVGEDDVLSASGGRSD